MLLKIKTNIQYCKGIQTKQYMQYLGDPVTLQDFKLSSRHADLKYFEKIICLQINEKLQLFKVHANNNKLS